MNMSPWIYASMGKVDNGRHEGSLHDGASARLRRSVRFFSMIVVGQ
jgi:hypothetical protein